MPTAWPHAPSEIKERLSFGTSVRGAFAAERRTTYRIASQRLLYGYAFDDDHEAAAAALVIRNNPSGEWYVPVWHEATRIAAALSASDVTLTAETDADYRAAGKAIGGTTTRLWTWPALGRGPSASLVA